MYNPWKYIYEFVLSDTTQIPARSSGRKNISQKANQCLGLINPFVGVQYIVFVYFDHEKVILQRAFCRQKNTYFWMFKPTGFEIRTWKRPSQRVFTLMKLIVDILLLLHILSKIQTKSANTNEVYRQKSQDCAESKRKVAIYSTQPSPCFPLLPTYLIDSA